MQGKVTGQVSMHENIKVGFQAFVDTSDEEFGAVRSIVSRDYITVYVENAGEFMVERTAVKSVQSEKVVFEYAKLDEKLRKAIQHAHDAEDPEL
jgi:hypothetical protein